MNLFVKNVVSYFVILSYRLNQKHINDARVEMTSSRFNR